MKKRQMMEVGYKIKAKSKITDILIQTNKLNQVFFLKFIHCVPALQSIISGMFPVSWIPCCSPFSSLSVPFLFCLSLLFNSQVLLYQKSRIIIIPLYGCKQSNHVCLAGLFILENSPANGWKSLSRSQVPPQWQRLPVFDTSIKLTDSAYLHVREKWTKPPSLCQLIHTGKTRRVFQEFISSTSQITLLRLWGGSQGGFPCSLQCLDLLSTPCLRCDHILFIMDLNLFFLSLEMHVSQTARIYTHSS